MRSDRRRAGFKLVRQIGVNRLLKRHAFDHVATALERIHRVKQTSLTIHHAAAGRRKHLVTGKSVEVTIQILNIDAAVRRLLGAVDQNRHTVFMGAFNDLFAQFNLRI